MLATTRLWFRNSTYCLSRREKLPHFTFHSKRSSFASSFPQHSLRAVSTTTRMTSNSIFDFSAPDLDTGATVELSKYRGLYCLITNVASFWGSTKEHYPKLKEWNTKFQDKGFIVLGFPCNQFGVQEPCSNDEIRKTIEFVRPGGGFKPNFPLFQKIEVNGANALPLFTFLHESPLKVTQRNNGWVINQTPPQLTLTRCLPHETQWNFEKYLCDQEGKPIRRFSHTTPLEQVEAEISRVLNS